MLSSIAFEFGQTAYKTAYVRLTDPFNDRFDIPSDFVNKPDP